MKRLSVTVLTCFIVMIYACKPNTGGNNQPNKTSVIDSPIINGAPDKQLKFIEIIDSTAYKSNSYSNDSDKKLKVTALYLQFRSYVKTTLENKFDDWTAKVIKIEKGDDEHPGIVLSFYIYNNEQTDKSVRINCYVPSSENELIDEIKSLSIGDRVTISGKFQYFNELLIKMQSTKGDNAFSEIFASPEFFVLLDKVKKIKD